MPLVSTIIWIVIHALFALALNYLAKELGLIKYSEIMTVYFVFLAGKYYDAQIKFTKAYKEDPELVEQILRDQLLED